ncbi:MAG: hypothetical protein KBC81_01520 [Candidatus Pacebacteria bacterium]|nr:hypothetical protein [Candidatus Paceibacterota bacterium]
MAGNDQPSEDQPSEIEQQAAADANNGVYDPPSVTPPVFVLNEATTTREVAEKEEYDKSYEAAKETRGW